MEFLKQLGITAENAGTSSGTQWINSKGATIDSSSPVDGGKIGSVTETDTAAYEALIGKAQEAFSVWRMWPAPKRGEIVRQVGDALRTHKEALGKLVSYEMGKSL